MAEIKMEISGYEEYNKIIDNTLNSPAKKCSNATFSIVDKAHCEIIINENNYYDINKLY